MNGLLLRLLEYRFCIVLVTNVSLKDRTFYSECCWYNTIY